MKKGKESPYFKDRAGEIYTTNEGYLIEIISYMGTKDCQIKFDNGVILSNIQLSNIKRGNVKNPKHLSVSGVGYMGVGKYSKGTHSNIHEKWSGILKRSYSKIYHKKRPSYVGCSVDNLWHNFQNFAVWFEDNWKPWMDTSWHLDKDILVKGNKVYSPETCCFVPLELNNLLTKSNSARGKFPIGISKNGKCFQAECQIGGGVKKYFGRYKTPEEAFQVYKTEKEKYIKEVANKWKDKIEFKVYQALISYQVEITD